jgi:hypothetical protein
VLETVSSCCRRQDKLNPDGSKIKKTVTDVDQPKRERQTGHTSQKPQKRSKMEKNFKVTCKKHFEGQKIC